MLTGALIVESLRVGAVLEGLDLTVRRLVRLAPNNVTPEQPAVWTLLEFASDQVDPDVLAEKLADVLDSPGWYANVYSDGQIYVVFPGRVFHYAQDDDARHEQAVAYARSAGVPADQCDWR